MSVREITEQFVSSVRAALSGVGEFAGCVPVIRPYGELLQDAHPLEFVLADDTGDLLTLDDRLVALLPIGEGREEQSLELFDSVVSGFASAEYLSDYGLTREVVPHCVRSDLFVYAVFAAPSPAALQAKRETPFEEDFHRCLLSNEPLYDAFLRMSAARLPRDAAARYARLRRTGFIMQDAADVDTYTHRVGRRHVPKFKWLYRSLFENYRRTFTSQIGLVVWGCGCGLDLIALYDQAMREGNPNFWLTVKSITLVDISTAAMMRAKEIAGILFPAATVTTVVVDLRDSAKIKECVRLEALFPYLPRVHLLSNIIDLFNDVTDFARAVWSVSARRIPNADRSAGWMWNEICVAFSPEYRGGRVRDNMRRFRESWRDRAEDLKLVGDAPQNCEYAAFTYRYLGEFTAGYACFESGGPLFWRMLRTLQGRLADRELLRLMQQLSETMMDGHAFTELYAYVAQCNVLQREKVARKDGTSWETVVRKAFFCTGGVGSHIKPCIVFFDRRPDERLAQRAVYQVLGYMESQLGDTQVHRDLLAYRSALESKSKEEGMQDGNTRSLDDQGNRLLSHVLVRWFDPAENSTSLRSVVGGTTQGASSRHELASEIDYSGYFVVVAGDVERLPALSPEQRRLADGHRQLCKIKGGPGVGKTVTMLWRALRVVQRKHLPVLVLCRTVSLISYNFKRLAASFFEENADVQTLDRSLFRFETIDRFLCDYQRNSGEGCPLRRCGECMRGCKRLKVLEYKLSADATAEDRARNEEIRACFNCEQCRRRSEVKCVCESLGCKGLTKDQLAGRWLGAEIKSRECTKCKASLTQRLRRRGGQNAGCELFGAVLVDEAQIVDPGMVRSVYNLTAVGNLWREFYLFCDAQQAFRGDTLEQDTETNRWVVKVPDTGFGHFVTLQENHRMKERPLVEACRIIQAHLKGKDEELTFFDLPDAPVEAGGTSAFAIRAVNGEVDFDFIRKEVAHLRSACGATAVTVICEQERMVRALAEGALAEKWITTHLPIQSYAAEKKLREEFYEHSGCNHLTSVDQAQGQTFETVVFILSSQRQQLDAGSLEQAFTALSRSGRILRVLDASPSHWLYKLLSGKEGKGNMHLA